MDSVEYCDECGGEIVGVICSVCYKRSKITRDIGYTKIYLQEKICDAKKGNKVDSLFYDKEFVQDVTGIDKLGRILCVHNNWKFWNYDKIIKSETVKRKIPKSVIDMRCHHSRYIYLDNELRFKKMKTRITNKYISGIEFFVDIGLGDNKKDLIIVAGFISHVLNSNNKKDIKEKIK